MAPLLVGGDVLDEPVVDVLLAEVELFDEELLDDVLFVEDEVIVVVLALAADDADEAREDCIEAAEDCTDI